MAGQANTYPRGGMMGLSRPVKGGMLPPNMITGELKSYTPTVRERMSDIVRSLLFTDDRTGQQRAEKVMDVLSLTPVGAAVDVYDAGREAGAGNYGTAGLMLGMAGIPGPSPNKGIRAFHGSPYDFDKFEAGKGRTARDIYLTPIKEDAQKYGKKTYEVNVSGKIGDFRPESRGPEEMAVLQQAYDSGLSDYFESFDEFLETFDSANMYQRFASPYAQNDTISNLLYDMEGARRFDAVRIPDAGFGGRQSESIVTDNPRILEIVKKYGIAGASAMLGYNLLEGMDPAQADELKRIEGQK
jgi:hypothetical protein